MGRSAAAPAPGVVSTPTQPAGGQHSASDDHSQAWKPTWRSSSSMGESREPSRCEAWPEGVTRAQGSKPRAHCEGCTHPCG
jgi:hypothetical protein